MVVMTVAKSEIRKKVEPYYECCAAPTIIEYKGRLVCRNCGIDHEPSFEPPIYAESMKNQIHNEPKQYLGVGSRTVFNVYEANHKRKYTYARMSALEKCRSGRDFAITKGRKLMCQIGSQLDIDSSFYQPITKLYLQVIKARLVVGRGIRELMAACFFLIFNQYGHPLDIRDLARVTRLSIKKIRRSYRLIIENFGLSINLVPPSYYIPRLLTKLSIPFQMARPITKLIERLNIPKIKVAQGRSLTAKAVAIAAIYIVIKPTEYRKTQKKVAEVSGISEVTVRKYIKFFKEEMSKHDK